MSLPSSKAPPAVPPQSGLSRVSPQARVPGSAFLILAGVVVPVLAFQVRIEPMSLPPLRPFTPLYMYLVVCALTGWMVVRGRASRLRAVCGGVLLPAGIAAGAIGIVLVPLIGMFAMLLVSEPWSWGYALLGLTPFPAAWAYWRVGRAELSRAHGDRRALSLFIAAGVMSMVVVLALGRYLHARVWHEVEVVRDDRTGASEGALRTLAWLYRFPGVDVRPLAWTAHDSELDSEASARMSAAWTSITGAPLPSD